MSDLTNQVRDLIQSKMLEKKISNSELAFRLGCSSENVRQMLTNGNKMYISTAEKIFKALGVEVLFAEPSDLDGG